MIPSDFLTLLFSRGVCLFQLRQLVFFFLCPPPPLSPKGREEKQVAEGDFTKNPWERMQVKWQERIKSKCTGGNKNEGKRKLLAPVYYPRLIVPQTRENGPNAGREVHPIFHFHITERGHAAAQGGTERTSRLQNRNVVSQFDNFVRMRTIQATARGQCCPKRQCCHRQKMQDSPTADERRHAHRPR